MGSQSKTSMKNLTILYYTANRIDERFASNVRESLSHIRRAGGFMVPTISVSQRRIDFGQNICVGDIGASVYNVYKQILIGAKEVKTQFTACAEDDTLYCAEHFTMRPSPNTFAYNMNRWIIDPNPVFRYRNRTGMCMCIVETQLLVDTLEERFAAYPDPLDGKLINGWGEPGRYERNLHLPTVKMEHFKTVEPCVHFNHKQSLRGVRSKNPSDILKDELPPWGTAKNLWESIHG
jgi:hypothetical protein